MTNYLLQTQRIYFDRLTIENVPIMLTAFNSPELENMVFIDAPLWGKFENTLIYEKKDLEDLLEKWSKTSKIQAYGIIKKESDELIGHFFYDYEWDTHFVFVHFVIYPEHQKKGYGKEIAPFILNLIFKNTITNNITIKFDQDNVIGMKFAEKLGFKSSGILRRAGYKGGKIRSLHTYDILRREWRNENANWG